MATIWGSRVNSGAGSLNVLIREYPVGSVFTIDELEKKIQQRRMKDRGAKEEHMLHLKKEGYVEKVRGVTRGWRRIR